MRATKGLWAALGAGTSLAAAALIALATMGVVLAVGGWPNGRYVGYDGSVALRAQRAASKHSAAARPANAFAKLPARALRHRARHTAVVHQVAARSPVARRHAGSGPATAKAIAPAQAPAGSSAPSVAPVTKVTQTVAAPVSKVTTTVGTTVASVTDTAGAILDPVSPTVGHTVTQTGQQAGQTIDQVGQTVGGIVGGLTGGK